MPLTSEQRTLLRETFRELGTDAEEKSTRFYEEFFRLDPGLRPMFRGDVGDQGMRFMSTLSFIVDHLGNPEALSARFRDLGQGHRALGVKAGHFALMEEALIATLRHYLGPRFTEEAEAAWRTAFAEISAEIIDHGEIGKA